MEKTFTLTLDNIEYTIEVNGNTLTVNGHPFVVGFEESGSVTVDGIAYDVELEDNRATVDGIAHQLQLSNLDDKQASAAPIAQAPSSAGAGAIRAIMPGTIVRVSVSEGDTVAVGDVLVVLEAMKMENELRAPIAGAVKAIFVQPGQTVEMNAVLVEIEPI